MNPCGPPYRAELAAPRLFGRREPLAWLSFLEGGTYTSPKDEFAFDHERPRHRSSASCQRANRPLTPPTCTRFVEAGGYQRPRALAPDGWMSGGKTAGFSPLYWESEAEWERKLAIDDAA